MATVRDDYNYRRIAKPPRFGHGARTRAAGVRVARQPRTPILPRWCARSSPMAERERILLRTARAERALYIEPYERTYETEADAIAVRRNNLGMKYLEHDLAKAFRNFLEAVAQDENFALAHNNPRSGIPGDRRPVQCSRTLEQGY